MINVSPLRLGILDFIDFASAFQFLFLSDPDFRSYQAILDTERN